MDFILVYCSVISLIVRNFSNLFLGKMPALQKAVEVDVCLEVTRKRGKKNQCKLGSDFTLKNNISWRVEQMPGKGGGCIKTPFYNSSCTFSLWLPNLYLNLVITKGYRMKSQYHKTTKQVVYL